MCDFKPGDEVVCVDAVDCPELIEGAPYIVARIIAHGEHWTDMWGRTFSNAAPVSIRVFGGFDFDGQTEDVPWTGYAPGRFRKVHRRDLNAWLETAVTDTDHLDKPIQRPARRRVEALQSWLRSGAVG